MIEDKDFSQKLLQEIKDKKVSPKPRWFFVAKNVLIWSLGLVFLLLSSFVFAPTIHMIRYGDWGFYNQSNHGFKLLFWSIPFFWLICLACFSALVYYNIKSTKHGYRYSPLLVFLAVFMLSFGFGLLFYRLGFGQKIDYAFSRNAPMYDSLINPRLHFWGQPEEGRLAGMIIKEKGKGVFILKDQSRHSWQVLTEKAEQEDGDEIKVGRPARLMGKMINNNTFEAKKIMPMPFGKGFFERPRSGDNLFCPRSINERGFDSSIESEIFRRHPELQKIWEDAVVNNQQQIRELIEKDPFFKDDLLRTGIREEILMEF